MQMLCKLSFHLVLSFLLIKLSFLVSSCIFLAILGFDFCAIYFLWMSTGAEDCAVCSICGMGSFFVWIVAIQFVRSYCVF